MTEVTDLVLRRLAYRQDGIFSVLLLDGVPRFMTLEHAFSNSLPPRPIIPPGEYTCQRGVHRLSDHAPFTTYEVMGVAGHTGLLFHWGNKDADTKGCILLRMQSGFLGDDLAVLNSRMAFAQFMYWAGGISSLLLTVIA